MTAPVRAYNPDRLTYLEIAKAGGDSLTQKINVTTTDDLQQALVAMSEAARADFAKQAEYTRLADAEEKLALVNEAILEHLRDFTEEFSYRFSALDQKIDILTRQLILILSTKPDPAEIRRIASEIEAIDQDSREAHQRRLIVEYTRHLEKLTEKAAAYGLDAPSFILNQIEDYEKKISDIQEGLDDR